MEEHILVSMISLNREYTKADYDQVYQLCQRCFPEDLDVTGLKYDVDNPDSFRLLITQLLPAFMMQSTFTRSRWKDFRTPTGKHWIDVRLSDDPSQPPDTSVGYHLTCENSLCGMAVITGRRERVVGIGLGIKQLKVEPKGTSAKLYLESLSHKLTGVEMANILGSPSDDVMLSRLCILLALKEAYIKAIGLPLGFDLTRIQFDVPNQLVSQDGRLLLGWEFRVFRSVIGVARGMALKKEEYECACAVYRGWQSGSILTFTTEISSWVDYINIDELLSSLLSINQLILFKLQTTQILSMS